MKTRCAFALGAIAVLGLALAISATDSLAQQKQRVSFSIPAENSKYVQQHVIEVGDTPGHEVRVYELRRSFPGNAPAINAVKVKEMIGSGMSDYVDGTGPNSNYTVFVLENGEKFFSRGTTLAQNTGSGKLSTVSVARITGGTGKLLGIQGTVRTTGTANPKANFSEAQYEIEYWIEK